MSSKTTTVTHTVRAGQLEHVVVVEGERLQTHTSRAAAMCALMLALACQGCATTGDWIKRHPVATAAIGGIVITSIVISRNPKGPAPAPEPRMSAPLTPDCSVYPEMCK